MKRYLMALLLFTAQRRHRYETVVYGAGCVGGSVQSVPSTELADLFTGN